MNLIAKEYLHKIDDREVRKMALAICDKLFEKKNMAYFIENLQYVSQYFAAELEEMGNMLRYETRKRIE